MCSSAGRTRQGLCSMLAAGSSSGGLQCTGVTTGCAERAPAARLATDAALFRQMLPLKLVVLAVTLYVSTNDWLMAIDTGGVMHSRTFSAVTPRISIGRGLA